LHFSTGKEKTNKNYSTNKMTTFDEKMSPKVQVKSQPEQGFQIVFKMIKTSLNMSNRHHHHHHHHHHHQNYSAKATFNGSVSIRCYEHCTASTAGSEIRLVMASLNCSHVFVKDAQPTERRTATIKNVTICNNTLASCWSRWSMV